MWIILYLVAVAGVIIAEHVTFGRLWRNAELSRRAMGIGTVFVLTLPPTLLGLLDWFTVLVLLAAFCVAGTVMWFMVTTESQVERKSRIDALRGVTNGRQENAR